MKALSALDHNSQSSREEIERQFGTILAASPYQFFILEQDGRRIIQIGKVPTGLPRAFQEKAFFPVICSFSPAKSGYPKSPPRKRFGI